MKIQYLLTIEFRYKCSPATNRDMDSKSKKITMGVYDDFDDACKEGNKNLEILESRFNLHKFPKGDFARKDRFSKNGGCFGSRKNLITNLAYLSTPFEFYFKITDLHYNSIEIVIDDVLTSVNEFKEYKKSCNDYD